MSDRQDAGWPSAIVGVALLLAITTIASVAIWKYSVDDALKVWSALGTLVGVVTGAFVTYFFTRTAVQLANQHAQKAASRAQTAEEGAAQASRRALEAATKADGLETTLNTLSTRLRGSKAWDEVAKESKITSLLPEGETGTS